MALPVNITTITLTGRYVDFEGNPVAGQVKIYPSQVLIDAAADRIIIPNTLTADLVNGSFSLTVPVTNDPDVTASNPGTTYYYWYEEAFNGGTTYKIFIPSSYGATVDISAIRETATVTQYIQPVSGDLWPPIEVRTTAVEGQYANLPSLTSPQQYRFLALKSGTYTQLATDYATYSLLTSSMNILFTTARIQTIIDRITHLNDFSANSTELRDTTTLGTLTRSGYIAHVAKWGTYQNWSNQYATYNLLTGASVSWTYAQMGTLFPDINRALTGSYLETASITDPWLKLTKVKSGNGYGAMTATGKTNQQIASTYATYADTQGILFSFTVRDTADRLKTSANHPHPLLTKGIEYGISV